MVDDAHVQAAVRLGGNAVADVAQADDAQRLALRVVRFLGRVVVRVQKGVGVTDPRRHVAPLHVAEHRDNVVQRHVGHGLGGRRRSVAVQDAVLGQHVDVGPVVAGACRSKHLERLGQERNQLAVPAAHLTSRRPPRAEDGRKVSLFFLL
jgi:hypothetical protein